MSKTPESDAPRGIPSLVRPVRTARGAKKYLSRLLSCYQAGTIDERNAKTSTYILNEFLHSIETADFEQKILDLEATLKKRERENR